MPPDVPDLPIEALLAEMERIQNMGGALVEEDTPTLKLSGQFLQNTWVECENGLLQKSNRIRVAPEYAASPRAFRFEFDLPYKSKVADQPVELNQGPLRGTVYYRRDLFANLDVPSVAVALDPDQHFFHPNFSRQQGLVCLGEIPPGPYALDVLLENHLYPILSYQNRRPTHPADVEAARYFALDPEAMVGLDAEPLY